MTREFLHRGLGILAYFAAFTLVGTAGYRVIEGASSDDSLYMTVITLTAVGYEEGVPLSRAGRNFTLFLLVGGITGMGLWFALITSFIVELDLGQTRRRRRTMKEIADLRDHVIVCGAGGMGRQVINEFVASAQPFVVIEKDPERIRIVEDDGGSR